MLLQALIVLLVFLKVSHSNSYPLEDYFGSEKNDFDEETDCGPKLEFNNAWNNGGSGSLYVPIPTNVETWKVKLIFSSPLTHLLVWDGLNIECTGNVCLFENQGYMEGIPLKIDFLTDMNKMMGFVPDLVALTVNECVYI